jgi:hypothetical protein
MLGEIAGSFFLFSSLVLLLVMLCTGCYDTLKIFTWQQQSSSQKCGL